MLSWTVLSGSAQGVVVVAHCAHYDRGRGLQVSWKFPCIDLVLPCLPALQAFGCRPGLPTISIVSARRCLVPGVLPSCRSSLFPNQPLLRRPDSRCERMAPACRVPAIICLIGFCSSHSGRAISRCDIAGLSPIAAFHRLPQSPSCAQACCIRVRCFSV